MPLAGARLGVLTVLAACAGLPAAAIIPPGVAHCVVDTDCTFLGDTNATCSATQVCACGTSYSGVLCHLPVGGVPPLKASLIIAGLMRNATCNRTDIGSYETAVKEKMESVDPSAVFASSCGSVTTVVDTKLTAATLEDGITAVVTAMRDAAVDMSDFSGVAEIELSFTVKPSTTTSANEVACTPNGATTFTAYDGRCIVIGCAPGYITSLETQGDKDIMTCVVPIPPPTFGNNKDGDHAAVAVGLLFIVIVAVATAYFILFRPYPPEPKPEGAGEDSKGTDREAPTGKNKKDTTRAMLDNGDDAPAKRTKGAPPK